MEGCLADESGRGSGEAPSWNCPELERKKARVVLVELGGAGWVGGCSETGVEAPEGAAEKVAPPTRREIPRANKGKLCSRDLRRRSASTNSREVESPLMSLILIPAKARVPITT